MLTQPLCDLIVAERLFFCGDNRFERLTHGEALIEELRQGHNVPARQCHHFIGNGARHRGLMQAQLLGKPGARQWFEIALAAQDELALLARYHFEQAAQGVVALLHTSDDHLGAFDALLQLFALVLMALVDSRFECRIEAQPSGDWREYFDGKRSVGAIRRPMNQRIRLLISRGVGHWGSTPAAPVGLSGIGRQVAAYETDRRFNFVG